MNSIRALIQDEGVAAVKLVNELEPVEGWDLSLFPATYPVADKAKVHRFDTPYTINELKDGRRVATLDSVQSQANRMEQVFSDTHRDAVPEVTVTAGERTVHLTELPHRVADAAIRVSDLQEEIRAAFEAYDAGDPLPIAKLGPTALVFGAWDSRDTRVRIPRLLRSEIHAWDVDVFTRSAQFAGTFSREELGFTEKEWKEGAEIGFAPTPSVDQHGGIVVHGSIRHTASLHLGAVRQLDRSTPGLGAYIFGLALTALWAACRDYQLRTGCWLVQKGEPQLESISRTGEHTPVEMNADGVADYLYSEALPAARDLGIPLGEEHSRSATYSPESGKKLLKQAKKSNNEG